MLWKKKDVLSIVAHLKKKKKKHSLPHFIFCCCFDDEGIINYEWPDVYFLSLLSCVE